MKRILIIGIILLILCAITLMCMYGDTLVVTEYTIQTNKLDKEITIAQISDFHNATLGDDIAVEISEIMPDYIVITGDFVDYYNPQIDVAIDLIEKVKNIAPIYFVQGNHEYYSDWYSELKENLISNDVIVLEDDCVELEKINFIGLLDASTTNVNVINDKYTILLAHRPELFDEYLKMNVDLILSGHTHGGQVRLPILGGFYAPNQGFFPKYLSGIYRKNNTTLIVSRGLGNGRIPIRINNNPELVVVHLE